MRDSVWPENSHQKALLGIYIDKTNLLCDDGTVLIAHERCFGAEHTDSNDYRTILCTLMKNRDSWKNRGIRQQAPAILRNYLE